jgi:hypothetical protein
MNIPTGGISLPIIYDFSKCIPVSEVIYTLKTKLTQTTGATTSESLLVMGGGK